MIYPVKEFDSAMVGAPTLNEQPGSLIALLDAVLLNGFGLVSVSSITRSGNIATAMAPTGHNRRVGDIVLIEGAPQAEYNGEAKILDVPSPTTCTFAVDGTPSTPATGTISMRVAPVGSWQKAFSDTNVAAYRSTAVGATGHFFRVSDTAAAASSTAASIRGFTSMSDVNTGVNPFPTTAQATGNPAGGGVIIKTSTTGAKNWMVVADDRFVYLFIEWITSYPGHYNPTFFGDFLSYRAGDPFGSIVGASLNSSISFPGHQNPTSDAAAYRWISGSYAGIPSSIVPYMSQHEARRNIPYPNNVNNGIMFGSGPLLHEALALASPIRGKLPGFYESLHVSSIVAVGFTVTNPIGMPNKQLMLVSNPYSSSNFVAGVDITGPWR